MDLISVIAAFKLWVLQRIGVKYVGTTLVRNA
jgi:hypothetical protein